MLAVSIAGGAGCSSDGTDRPPDTALPEPSGPYTVNVEPCESGPKAARGTDSELPALRLPCLGAGPAIDLAELGGQPTVVNAWASWCGPCRREMPGMQEVYQEHGDEVRFLGVSTRDDPRAAAAFVEELGVTYPQVIDQDGQLLRPLAAPGLPVTLVLDAQGRVSTKHLGEMQPAQLRAAIERAR
ncbi:MAG: redoxin domain-containing protein [Micromonosporaceae bacterium]|nr:redoxin domain-containing protein [Micromonosporaceae bacterium]